MAAEFLLFQADLDGRDMTEWQLREDALNLQGPASNSISEPLDHSSCSYALMSHTICNPSLRSHPTDAQAATLGHEFGASDVA